MHEENLNNDLISFVTLRVIYMGVIYNLKKTGLRIWEEII